MTMPISTPDPATPIKMISSTCTTGTVDRSCDSRFYKREGLEDASSGPSRPQARFTPGRARTDRRDRVRFILLVRPVWADEMLANCRRPPTHPRRPAHAPAALAAVPLGFDTSRTTSPAARSDTRRAMSACDTIPMQFPCASTTGTRRI
jgi:hypothetical protein